MNKPKQYEFREEFGVFRLTDPTCLSEGIELVTEAITYTREMQLRRLLVLATPLISVDPPPSLVARFFLMREWAEAGKGEVRLALVLRPEMIREDRHAIRLAADLGLVCEGFTAEQEAIDWLREE